jgi:hypothetical protein
LVELFFRTTGEEGRGEEGGGRRKEEGGRRRLWLMLSQVRAINDRFGIMKSDRNDGKWLDSNKIEKICEKLGEIQISIFNHTGIRQWEIYSLGES